jgi:hypothetical protein
MPASPRSSTPIADEILRYLTSHPGAEDTTEGIAEWWALNQRVASSRRTLEATLNDLARAGRLIVSTGADGRCRYRRKP